MSRARKVHPTKEWARLIREGSSQEKIGKSVGLCQSWIGELLRRDGFVCRERPAKRTSAEIEGARKLWDQGLSMTEIGRSLGVSKSVIAGISHRNDFAVRPSPIPQVTIVEQVCAVCGDRRMVTLKRKKATCGSIACIHARRVAAGRISAPRNFNRRRHD